VVPGANPDSAVLTAWLVVPEPTDWLEVALKVDSVGLVPHSNQAVVACPFGFTPPFTVAPPVVTEVAALVDAVGGRSGMGVVKLAIEPFVVPLGLEAAARK